MEVDAHPARTPMVLRALLALPTAIAQEGAALPRRALRILRQSLACQLQTYVSATLVTTALPEARAQSVRPIATAQGQESIYALSTASLHLFLSMFCPARAQLLTRVQTERRAFRARPVHGATAETQQIAMMTLTLLSCPPRSRPALVMLALRETMGSTLALGAYTGLISRPREMQRATSALLEHGRGSLRLQATQRVSTVHCTQIRALDRTKSRNVLVMLATLAGKSHIDSTVPWFLNHIRNILILKSCCSDGGPCANCEAGTWKSAQGSAACTECVAGKYSTALAAIALSTCLDCPTNSNSPAKSDSILKCTSILVRLDLMELPALCARLGPTRVPRGPWSAPNALVIRTLLVSLQTRFSWSIRLSSSLLLVYVFFLHCTFQPWMLGPQKILPRSGRFGALVCQACCSFFPRCPP